MREESATIRPKPAPARARSDDRPPHRPLQWQPREKGDSLSGPRRGEQGGQWIWAGGIVISGRQPSARWWPVSCSDPARRCTSPCWGCQRGIGGPQRPSVASGGEPGRGRRRVVHSALPTTILRPLCRPPRPLCPLPGGRRSSSLEPEGRLHPACAQRSGSSSGYRCSGRPERGSGRSACSLEHASGAVSGIDQVRGLDHCRNVAGEGSVTTREQLDHPLRRHARPRSLLHGRVHGRPRRPVGVDGHVRGRTPILDGEGQGLS